MKLRLLILELTATLSLWLCGCSMPPINLPTPQPVAPVQPTKHTIDITVSGTGQVNVAGGADVNVKSAAQPDQPRAAGCDCGCGKSSCDCSARGNAGKAQSSASTSATAGPQLSSAILDSKPVVEMLSDFEPGQCGACDLAWSDWQANGANWPFTLVKRRGTGGKTSPTFVMPGREPWSPQTYSVGGLVERWRTNR